MIDFHDFPQNEYKLRHKRARELMDEKGLDGLLVGEECNCRYLSGYTAHSDQRPAFIILPLDGDLILIGGSKAPVAFLPGKRSWIKDIRGYSLPFTYKVIKQALQDSGLAESKIGTELNDTFFHSKLNYEGLTKLKKELLKAKFIDGSDIMWKLRIKKSEAEIDCLRKSGEIASKSFDVLFDNLREGMTERDIAQILITTFMKLGADYPSRGMRGPAVHIVVYTQPRSATPGIPTNKPIKKGDTIVVDSGAVYKGYSCEFNRCAVVGKPSEKLRKIYREFLKENKKSVEMIKAGTKMGELPIWTHGIGLGKIVELPYPNFALDGIPYDEIVIEEGLTLATETIGEHRGYQIATEQNVVVTKDGNEVLTGKLPEEIICVT